MRALTTDVFVATKDNIQNQDVPELLQAALFKQLHFVMPHEEKMHRRKNQSDGALIMRINFYKAFFKQFNTILTLAKSISFVFDQGTKYLDITSIFTLIRSCHERYLSFWLLGHSLGCWRVTSEEELHFRWLCFRHSGIIDEQKTFRFLSRIRDISTMSQNRQKQAGEGNKIFNEIGNPP